MIGKSNYLLSAPSITITHFDNLENKNRDQEATKLRELFNEADSWISGDNYKVYILYQYRRNVEIKIEVYTESGEYIDEVTGFITFSETEKFINEILEEYSSSSEGRDITDGRYTYDD